MKAKKIKAWAVVPRKGGWIDSLHEKKYLAAERCEYVNGGAGSKCRVVPLTGHYTPATRRTKKGTR